MPHPVVATFDAMLDAVDAFARIDLSSMFLLDVGPKGARVGYVDDDDNALHLSDAPFSGHQRLALIDTSSPLLAAAQAWHLACKAVPGFAPFVGTGRLVFTTEDGDLHLSWSFCDTKLPMDEIPVDHPYEASRERLTGCLERACAVAEATPHPSCQALTLFEPYTMQPQGPFFSTAPLMLAFLPMSYTFDEPSEIAYIGGPVVHVALQRAYDRAERRQLRATSEAVQRFETALQRLVACLDQPPLQALRGVRLAAKAAPRLDGRVDGPPRIVAEVTGLFQGSPGIAHHLFDAATRSLDALPPEDDAPTPICSEQSVAWARGVVQAWRDAVAALPTDGQWIHHGLSGSLLSGMLPHKTTGNGVGLVLFGPNGWVTPPNLTPWTVRSSGQPFLVRAWNAPTAHGMRVDAPDAETAAAVALTAYGEGPQQGPKGFDVWPLVGTIQA